MEDWSLPPTIQIEVSGHDAATLQGLPASFFLNASNISAGVLNQAQISNLDWSKITTGKPTTLAGYGITDALTVAGTGLTSTGNTVNVIGTSGRIIANVDSIDLATIGTQGTYTKCTTDGYGRVMSGTTLADTDIPALPASKIINTAVTLSDTQTITGPKTFSNGFVSGNLTVGGTSQQAKLVVNRLGGNFTHPSLDANTAVVITAGGGLAASGAAISLVGGNTSVVGLWFGDTDDTVIGGVQYHHLNDTLFFRTGGINRVNINSTTCSIPISTASTSTTTGAIVTPGGVGVGGALFAQSLNGQLVLAKYTTATRPVASAGTLGQVWLNTDTGKIEYVATISTIQSITSA